MPLAARSVDCAGTDNGVSPLAQDRAGGLMPGRPGGPCSRTILQGGGRHTGPGHQGIVAGHAGCHPAARWGYEAARPPVREPVGLQQGALPAREHVVDDACRQHHVDSVKFRLLCTYAGLGTDWIDPAGEHPMAAFDVAVFKGLKFPDSAPRLLPKTQRSRLLLCIDQPGVF
jgi:hypothetical protein